MNNNGALPQVLPTQAVNKEALLATIQDREIPSNGFKVKPLSVQRYFN